MKNYSNQNPYDELRTAYDAGYKAGYDVGYKKGYGELSTDVNKKYYDMVYMKGLEEAWACAREIINRTEDVKWYLNIDDLSAYECIEMYKKDKENGSI